jgi:acyl carrier protein
MDCLSSAEILDRVQAILYRSVGPCEDEESLVSAGRIGSVNIVDLVLGLEQAFGIAIPQDEMKAEHFETAARLARHRDGPWSRS